MKSSQILMPGAFALRHPIRGVRAFTRDHMLTMDRAVMVMDSSPLWIGGDQIPVDPGKKLGYGINGSNGVRVRDAQGKYRVVDSTGAFLIGELERLDMKMHEPLAAVTFARDIDMREDVTIADEVSSFSLSTFGAAGSLGTGNGIRNGKSWIGKSTDQIGGVNLDIAKLANALTPWGMELKYTILELESAAKIGRPIDQQKYAGLQLKHQMDVDEQVYVGDAGLDVGGLVNHDLVTNVANVENGASGTPEWATKTPDEILADVNELLTSVWAASAFAVFPDKLLLPTTAYGAIATRKVSEAGNVSIMSYLLENNIAKKQGGGLEINPVKWCNGAGAGGTIGTGDAGLDRMVAYKKEQDKVRFPMTLLQRTPIQYDSIYHKSTYFCRLGVVEVVYPETLGYRDKIS